MRKALISALAVMLSVSVSFGATHTLTTAQKTKLGEDVAGLKKKSTITFKSKKNLDAPEIGDVWIYPAKYIETGQGVQGDYARSICCEYSGRFLKERKGKKYKYTIKLNYKYRTTPKEEKKVSTTAKKLITKTHLKKLPPYARVIAINKYISETVRYSEEYGVKSHTAYGAYRGKAVCEGYAAWFYKLCREADVPCRMIYGKSHGQGHVWNIVKLGKKWYNVDPTWNDDSTFTSAAYLLMGNTAFNRDHKAEAMYKSKKFNKDFPISKTDYKNKAVLKAREWVLKNKN